MICPHCGGSNIRVVSSSNKDKARIRFRHSIVDSLSEVPDYVMRQRSCGDCCQDFITIEVPLVTDYGFITETRNIGLTNALNKELQ